MGGKGKDIVMGAGKGRKRPSSKGKGKGSDGKQRQQRASSKGGKRSKGNKDGKSTDGGVSPPEERAPRIGGISVGEGAWRLVQLPEDRVLKVLVPFFGQCFA